MIALEGILRLSSRLIRTQRTPVGVFVNSSSNHLGRRCLSSSAKKRDYYEILGLPKTATKAEIKKSYFELAKKYHPDVNKEKGAEQRFKEVTEAYECLEDDQKRQMYDNFGHEAANAHDQGNPFQGFGGFQGFQGFNNAGGFRVNFQEGSFEDLFDLFGGAFGQMGPNRDLQTRVRLSFFEAVNGCKKDINLEYFVVTSARGRQQRERKTKRVTIDIPPGVDNNMVLRAEGQGAGEGRAAGDLLVEIEVEEDSYFSRQGYDIITNVNVPLTTVRLGIGSAKISVTFLTGYTGRVD